ncbi:MAG: S-adenosyl-l-methionine hydroxide adenosyltransferase family protein [Flavobacteriaceae bacterium]
MNFITLTTDFGYKDFSVAITKANIYNNINDVIIVDISHQISPFNTPQAAYILKNSYNSFPEGTIHIIGVESELTPENSHLAMRFNNHYFVGANNGIFSLITQDLKPDKIVEINIHENIISNFPVIDVFVNVAKHLSSKGSLDVIGKEIKKIKQLTEIKPVINQKKDQILGSVIYIDNYGNVVTNITKKIFNEIGKSRSFIIEARRVKFRKIFSNYSQAIDFSVKKEKREEDGKKLALFNSAGHLELSIYKSNPETVGSASSLFGLDYRDPITIFFE